MHMSVVDRPISNDYHNGLYMYLFDYNYSIKRDSAVKTRVQKMNL